MGSLDDSENNIQCGLFCYNIIEEVSNAAFDEKMSSTDAKRQKLKELWLENIKSLGGLPDIHSQAESKDVSMTLNGHYRLTEECERHVLPYKRPKPPDRYMARPVLEDDDHKVKLHFRLVDRSLQTSGNQESEIVDRNTAANDLEVATNSTCAKIIAAYCSVPVLGAAVHISTSEWEDKKMRVIQIFGLKDMYWELDPLKYHPQEAWDVGVLQVPHYSSSSSRSVRESLHVSLRDWKGTELSNVPWPKRFYCNSTSGGDDSAQLRPYEANIHCYKQLSDDKAEILLHSYKVILGNTTKNPPRAMRELSSSSIEQEQLSSTVEREPVPSEVEREQIISGESLEDDDTYVLENLERMLLLEGEEEDPSDDEALVRFLSSSGMEANDAGNFMGGTSTTLGTRLASSALQVQEGDIVLDSIGKLLATQIFAAENEAEEYLTALIQSNPPSEWIISLRDRPEILTAESLEEQCGELTTDLPDIESLVIGRCKKVYRMFDYWRFKLRNVYFRANGCDLIAKECTVDLSLPDFLKNYH